MECCLCQGQPQHRLGDPVLCTGHPSDRSSEFPVPSASINGQKGESQELPVFVSGCLSAPSSKEKRGLLPSEMGVLAQNGCLYGVSVH